MKSQRIVVTSILSLVGIWLLSACGTLAVAPAEASPLPTPDAALIQHGIEVYRSQYCGMCHTLAAANTQGTFGPNHDAAGSIAAERIQETNYSGTAKTAEAYLRESISDPAIYKVPEYTLSNHQMPAFSHLPAEDIDALVYLLLHQQQG